MKPFSAWRSGPRLAFDVGTANLRVISSEDGILLDEPAICCFDRWSTPSRLIAAGVAALPMVGRTTPDLEIRHPLRRGVLQDLEATRALLKHVRQIVLGRRAWSRQPSLIGIPADATEVERRALLTAAQEAGFGSVRLVSEPMAAAIGAGLDVGEPCGSMLIECGAGVTEVVVISLGAVVVRQTVRVGGDALDQSISDHLHLQHKFMIGKHTAQELKLEICRAALSGNRDAHIDIRGASLTSGLPAILGLRASSFEPVIDRHVRIIVEAVKDCLAQTPPELSRDIWETGVTLTGGSANLPWLGRAIAEVSGLSSTVAADAQQCVSRGLREMLLH